MMSEAEKPAGVSEGSLENLEATYGFESDPKLLAERKASLLVDLAGTGKLGPPKGDPKGPGLSSEVDFACLMDWTVGRVARLELAVEALLSMRAR